MYFWIVSRSLKSDKVMDIIIRIGEFYVSWKVRLLVMDNTWLGCKFNWYLGIPIFLSMDLLNELVERILSEIQSLQGEHIMLKFFFLRHYLLPTFSDNVTCSMQGPLNKREPRRVMWNSRLEQATSDLRIRYMNMFTRRSSVRVFNYGYFTMRSPHLGYSYVVGGAGEAYTICTLWGIATKYTSVGIQTM